ncbi:fatty acyl-AMP ligase [Larkinella soli]|uniref:fatty acyl-AMP ligase n=1 Tax=Larkinella soli TaxID=1770527 RepID=UPI000FFC8989|nr:fatty acyl-AMP ligase [Larkinella soli]
MTEKSRSIVEVLLHRAAHTPLRTAYLFLADGETQEESLTYQELNDRACSVAAVLRQHQGIAGTVGPRVLLVYPQGLDFINAFLGCLYAGYVAVPVSVPAKNRGSEKITHILNDAGITVALTTAKTHSQLQRLFEGEAWFQSLTWILTDLLPAPAETSVELPARDTLAFLQYTSGSTGHPKGVMVTHGNIMANSAFIRHAFQNDEASVSVCWLPSFHDMGLIDGILQPLYSGFTAVLLSPVHVMQKPVRWLRAFSRYGGTYGGAPNFAFDFCVDRVSPQEREGLDLSGIRHLYNAAEPIRATSMSRFLEIYDPYGFRPESLFTCYGLAESTLAVTMCRTDRRPVRIAVDAEQLELGRFQEISEDACGRTLLTCSGWPMSDSILRIVDPETGRSCRENEVGEIWTAGPSVARGYWHKPDRTAEIFNAYTVEGEGPFLRTGDLGVYDPKKGLFVTGRIKDLIIIRGTNHYPQDIEWTVEQSHEGLQPNAGAAFPIETEQGEQLVIIQELKRTALRTMNPETVVEAILRRISLHHGLSPVCVVLLPPGGVLKTTSGKVQRSACRQAFRAGALAEHYRWEPLPSSIIL